MRIKSYWTTDRTCNLFLQFGTVKAIPRLSSLFLFQMAKKVDNKHRPEHCGQKDTVIKSIETDSTRRSYNIILYIDDIYES